MVLIKDRTFEILLQESLIQERVRELGKTISLDYEGKNPLFIIVLNGAFVFAADLARSVDIPSEFTFIKVASYDGIESRGEVEEILGLEADIKGRHVIVVEDIVDSGVTIHELLQTMKQFKPASLEVATFLLKPSSLKKNISPRYIGVVIDNAFVVGYGLDYDGFGRNLPNIYREYKPQEIA